MEQSSLPRPSGDAIESIVETIPPHSFVFPQPLCQMPYEIRSGVTFYSSGVGGQARKVTVPVYVRVEVWPEEEDAECIMIATCNCQKNGHGGDGLTVYSSVDRTDFSFRTSVFESFPEAMQHNRVLLQRGQWNEIGMALGEQRATYWINGTRVATCFMNGTDLPGTELYVGLASYNNAYRHRRFDVSRDPSLCRILADRVVTVDASMQNSAITVACLGVNGDNIAEIDAGRATRLLDGTRVVTTRSVIAIAIEGDSHQFYWVPQDQETEVAENVDESMGDEDEDEDRCPGALRVRVQPGSDGCVKASLLDGSLCVEFNDQEYMLWVRHDDLDALHVADEVEVRLADLRTKLAAHLGVFECDLQLALTDGTYLEKNDDATCLRELFTLS